MKMFRKAIVLMIVLCVTVGLAFAGGAGEKPAAGAAAPAPADEIKAATYTWIAGGMGGGWYTMAGGFARLVNEKEPKITIKVIPGGGVANPSQLSNGDADFAWGVGYVDKAAYNGLAPIYDKAYRNIASYAGTMAVDYYHFLAAKDQGVTKFEELIARIKNGEKVKIAAPMTGTSDFVMTSFVLKFYGVSYDQIYELCRRGNGVVLVDKVVMGAGASCSCDDMILLQSKKPGILLEMAFRSLERFRELVAELPCDIEFENRGGTILIEDQTQLTAMEEFVASQNRFGLEVEIIDARRLRELQPHVSPHVIASTYSAWDSQVNPMQLMKAFLLGAVNGGRHAVPRRSARTPRVLHGRRA